MTSIDFTLDDTTYTITHKGSKYTLDGEEVDFDDIKSAVDGLDIAEYNTETSDKKQEIALTVHLDNTDYPTLTLCAYQYDGENCLVTLNNTTLGFAKRSLVVDLEEAVNADLCFLHPAFSLPKGMICIRYPVLSTSRVRSAIGIISATLSGGVHTIACSPILRSKRTLSVIRSLSILLNASSNTTRRTVLPKLVASLVRYNCANEANTAM